jgi:lipopolysaccharide export system permease protein
MRDFNAATNTGNMVSVRHYEDQNSQPLDARGSRGRSNWCFTMVIQRVFRDSSEQAVPFTRMVIDSTSLLPQDISRFFNQPEEMSSTELRQFIQEVKRNGADPNRWLVDLHLKYAIPLANLIIILFGAPLASKKSRGSATAGFGLSLIVVFIYFGMVKTSQAMGQNGVLPPLVAAWLANISFAAAGLAVLVKTAK